MEPEGEEFGRFGPEGQEAGHGRAVYAVFVPEGHPGVPQQVEPGDGRRSPEERFEPATVQGVHGCGEDGLLVEAYSRPRCWNSRTGSGDVRPRLVEPIRM